MNFLCTETVYLDNKSGNGNATKKNSELSYGFIIEACFSLFPGGLRLQAPSVGENEATTGNTPPFAGYVCHVPV